MAELGRAGVLASVEARRELGKTVRERLRDQVEAEASGIWRVYRDAFDAEAGDGDPDHRARLASVEGVLAQAVLCMVLRSVVVSSLRQPLTPFGSRHYDAPVTKASSSARSLRRPSILGSAGKAIVGWGKTRLRRTRVVGRRALAESPDSPQANGTVLESAIDQVRKMKERDLAQIAPGDRAKLATKLAKVPMEVPCRDGELRFLNVSTKACHRARDLHSTEPDSLRWIDRMEPGSVFWDIGANIGILSLYAAQRGDLDVHAFEPAAVNYYLLAANCELNGFQDVLSCYLLGFSDETRVGRIEASQLAAGASFSFKGKKGKEWAGRYQTCLLFSIDDFLDRFEVPFPNYVKIDVPGLTDEIFYGATRALVRPELREIQVEMREHKQADRRLLPFLEPYGFRVIHRNQRADGRIAELVLGRTTESPLAQE